MKLGNLDEVTAMSNHRRKALELFAASESGLIECQLRYQGDRLDVFSVISADPVRAAIRKACSEYIAEIDKRLADFGVEP